MGTGSHPAPSWLFELLVEAAATAAAITMVAKSMRSDFFMGSPPKGVLVTELLT